jgi:hypothetical protein
MQQTHNLKLTTITFVEPTETNMAADWLFMYDPT